LDIDECQQSPRPCQHFCTNLVGSYACSCRSGYRPDSAGDNCVDVDECAAGTSACAGSCTNTDGSFSCGGCEDGSQASLLYPGVCNPSQVNLLAGATLVGDAVAVDAEVYMDGASDAALDSTKFHLLDAFTFTADFRTVSGRSGYLYARTNADGTKRHFGIYVAGASDSIRVWYHPVGAISSESLQFSLAAPVNDGVWHSIMITVMGLTLTLFVDGSNLPSQQLSGPISDCGLTGPDCLSVVGARTNAGRLSSGLRGIIRSAVLFPFRALTAQPSLASMERVPATGEGFPQFPWG